MKRIFLITLSVLAVFGLLDVLQAHLDHRLYDLQEGQAKMMAEAISELKKNRVILVGEHHTNINHHFGQLNVIQSLKEAGVRVAIGLEMFRSDSQQALDQWVAGNINEKQFEAIYYDNWTYPWPVYRMIFEYARQEKIAMIGLNVPREITRQVSKGGFNSLTEEQKGKLTAMAVNTLEYLKKEPDSVVILLAGTGHVRKGAVPRQIRDRSDLPHAVILPRVEGIIDLQTVSIKDADYIMLDF